MSQLFTVLAPQWWNELPAHVRAAESFASFRKRLKTHLFRVHLDSEPPPHPPLIILTLTCVFVRLDIY